MEYGPKFDECFFSILVTNPIDVLKIRMQLDNELTTKSGALGHFRDRYYKGFIRGGIRIIQDEGVRGLYKGYSKYLTPFTLVHITRVWSKQWLTLMSS